MKQPIKGYSLYTTDGRGVYLRHVTLYPVNGEYALIPDGGDGVNTVKISEADALAGGKDGNTAKSGAGVQPSIIADDKGNTESAPKLGKSRKKQGGR